MSCRRLLSLFRSAVFPRLATWRSRGPRLLALVAACHGLVACALDVPTPPAAFEGKVTFEGSVPGDAGVPTIFIARTPRSEAPLPRLFIGILSDYHRAHADDSELSSTLAVREVPLWVQRGSAEQTLMPLEALQPRSQYSLVTGVDRPFEFMTRRAQPKLVRVWPKPAPSTTAARGGSQRVVYCAAPESESQARLMDLSVLDVDPNLEVSNAGAGSSPGDKEPALEWPLELDNPLSLLLGSKANWTPLPGRAGCALLSVEGALPRDGDITPPRLNGVLAAPAVFTPREQQAAEITSPQCSDAAALPPGCALVHDDRLILSYEASPALWCFTGELSGCVTTEPGQSAVVRGLTPQSRYAVELSVSRADGVVWSSAPEIETAAAREHVVINEVLSNPNGPEPQQEWVELYNDGVRPVELGGWQLADSAGVSALPSLSLAAGEYALLVNEGFMANTELDVAPPPDVTLVPLPRLASGGLSNSGEALRLSTAEGRLVSSWPAMRGAAGVSLARRAPSAGAAADVDIVLHAEPGASPGLPNHVPAQQVAAP